MQFAPKKQSVKMNQHHPTILYSTCLFNVHYLRLCNPRFKSIHRLLPKPFDERWSRCGVFGP